VVVVPTNHRRRRSNDLSCNRAILLIFLHSAMPVATPATRLCDSGPGLGKFRNALVRVELADGRVRG